MPALSDYDVPLVWGVRPEEGFTCCLLCYIVATSYTQSPSLRGGWILHTTTAIFKFCYTGVWSAVLRPCQGPSVALRRPMHFATQPERPEAAIYCSHHRGHQQTQQLLCSAWMQHDQTPQPQLLRRASIRCCPIAGSHHHQHRLRWPHYPLLAPDVLVQQCCLPRWAMACLAAFCTASRVDRTPMLSA